MATQLNNSGVLFPDGTTQISAGLTPGNWNTVSSGTGATLAPGERYYLTTVGAVNLPPTPAVGSQITIAVGQTNITSVVGRNGQNIMGLAQDMTIDVANIAVTMEYMGGAIGWQIF